MPPLYFHGGAWNFGLRRFHADSAFLLRLAEQGWVVVSASYRFTWRGTSAAPFPACLRDCLQAAEWTARHADRYGGDARRLVVMGASAGGHLAALLAAHIHGKPNPCLPAPSPGLRVWRSVLMYPVLDLRDTNQVGCSFPCAVPPLGPRASRGVPFMRWFFGIAVLRADDPGLWDAADPMVQLSAALPPTLVVHGTHDSIVPIEHSGAYVARLRILRGPEAEGRPHRDGLLPLPGARHASSFFLTPQTLAAYDIILDWLEPDATPRGPLRSPLNPPIQ
jgi:acetyl esterase/lipase